MAYTVVYTTPSGERSEDHPDHVRAIERALTVTGAPLVEALEKRTQELAARSAEAARLLRASVEEGAARALAGLAETGDRLHGDLGGLLARIETANAALSELVSGAGENLGAIEAGLAGRVEQIQTALGRIAAETVRASDGVGAQIDDVRNKIDGAIGNE